MSHPIKMLAIDLGASSGRGISGAYDGRVLTLEERHRFPNEPVSAAGNLQWDILRIFHEIGTAIARSAQADGEISTIGIDTWGCDYGLLDRSGALIENPFHYRDRRTDDIFERAFAIMPKGGIYAANGLQFMRFNTIFQLLALADARPYMLGAADQLLFTPDLLNYLLTGERRTEYTIASTGGLLDAASRTWSDELFSRFGLPRRIFSERLTQPGSVIGPLLPEIRELCGGTGANVVAAASHDTASAVVSVPAEGKDFIYISSGTWSLMGTETAEPIISEKSLQYNFTNEGGACGTIRVLKNIMGLWLEQESKRQWEREGGTVSFNALSDMAMVNAPCRSLINPDNFVFSPPGNMPRRIADYCRGSGQPAPADKGQITRCVFDSLALKYRQVCDMIDSLRGVRAPFIHIVGGGTREEPLCQLCADACNRPVYAGPVEATAIGNLIAQLMAQGELSSLEQGRELVRRSFEIKRYDPKPEQTRVFDEAYERFAGLE